MEILYKGVPLKLQSGDVVLFRNKVRLLRPMTWLAGAIRRITNFEYNHVAVVVSNWYNLELNEAVASGIIGRSASLYLERPETSIKVLRPHQMLTEAEYCSRANAAKGRGYDFKNLLFKQLWYRITQRWKRENEQREEARMVCSEYAGWTHALPEWWKMSAKELNNCGAFYTVFEERGHWRN